jgi:uncharacterized protein (DUF3084 family)
MGEPMCVRPKVVLVQCRRRLGREEEAKRECHEERKFVRSRLKACIQRKRLLQKFHDKGRRNIPS